MKRQLITASAGLLACVTLAHAENSDLSYMTLEALLGVEVKSVSRKDQKLGQTAAAVYVITRDDIRRSGATSLPEVLRLAPGLQVARISSSSWAVTARGFNGRIANKMLVLIDGRSVYNSLYSGVFWDQNEVMLEDVDRIEVIRGPGATMWGANAVNGVINVITRSAQDTQGFLASAQGGRNDWGSTALRYGGRAGERVAYRVQAQATASSPMQREDGSRVDDGWRRVRAGGRLEWQAGERDSLTFHGDMYRGHGSQEIDPTPQFLNPISDRIRTSGGYALGRWERKLAHSEFAVQGFYNLESRRELVGGGSLHTVDLDFQHRIQAGSRNDVMWGGGYRLRESRNGETGWPFQKDRFEDHLASAFVQDDFTILRDKLVVTGGVKLERNRYTGLEWQPGARLMWTPDASQAIWCSVSRAVRLPSMQDLDLLIYGDLAPEQGLPAYELYQGNPRFAPEGLTAVEAGYRRQISSRVALDVAVFRNWYSNLQAVEALPPFITEAPEPVFIRSYTYGNSMAGHSDGIESSLTWTPKHWWRLTGSHTWMDGEFSYRKSIGVPVGNDNHLEAPHNSVTARSSIDIRRKWTVDTTAFFTSGIRDTAIPQYVRLDARVGYRLGEFGEISAGVTDALRPRHMEFRPLNEYALPSQIQRSFYVKIVRSF